jgi:hypothetical protein
MGQYLGPGLLGLGVTAMIAGFMSGMAGNISAFATVWTYDVYKPLIKKRASDSHYLSMGRWCSLIGIGISIGTAYLLFAFSNILEYLQVLVFLFIVPLFGAVILGMLWKGATPAGGFWGFLSAILVSIWMWAYVHSFPDGYRPQPKVTLSAGAVVSKERGPDGKLARLVIQSGKVELVNVPLTASGPIVKARLTLPARVKETGGETPVQVLAPEVVLSETKQGDKFGVEAVPVVLEPGVEVHAATVSSRFVPSAFNPRHAKLIARSEKAKPMAVNMYSAWWSFVVCVSITFLVSLFTERKPEAELKDLVMGLTTLPDQGPCPWYRKPLFWAGVVAAVLVAINIIFW